MLNSESWCNLVPADIANYCANRSNLYLSAEEHRAWTEDKMPMLADYVMPETQAAFLSMLVSITGAKKIFEMGTFTGYCTLYLIKNLPEGGLVISVESNPDFAREVKKFFYMNPRVIVIEGRGQSIIRNYSELDLVIIDGEKIEYDECVEAAIPQVRSGGLIVLDNTLWRGRVLNPNYNEQAEALAKLNEKLVNDGRVEAVMLPAWDGMTILRKL